MVRLLLKLFAGYLLLCALLGVSVMVWSEAERFYDPTAYAERQRRAEAEAQAAEIARLEQERAETAERLAAMSPAERADAYAAALDPAVRSAAEQAVTTAGIALYQARAAVPFTDEDAIRLQAEERAAKRHWASAMRRLYGPTWEAYQARLEGQASDAAAAAASRL